MATSAEFQVSGQNASASFTLKAHRGEGMLLLAMNWRSGKPPPDFVGFAIQYQEPGSDRLLSVRNRLRFPGPSGNVTLAANALSTLHAPIQRFRWIHFPFNAELPGEFRYRVTPVFMDEDDVLSYGEAQTVALELRRETYPGQLNVSFTRGFVSSQAFVDRYRSISKLLPKKAADGLDFVPTHEDTAEALDWMGFEARHAVLDVLDQALADPSAQVRVVAYDLNEPGVMSRLEALGSRLRVIIDDSGEHGEAESAETEAVTRLTATAGAANVKRQKMGALQHNKTIIVSSPVLQLVVCGSTNFSWRGFFVQSNNALVVQGKTAVKVFSRAFEGYWQHDDVDGFSQTAAATWKSLGLTGIRAKAAFSPHSADNALLAKVAQDIEGATSTVLYSLAFLHQTGGAIRDAIRAITPREDLFVVGISDKKVGGLDVQLPGGNIEPVFPEALTSRVPEPFKSEPTGGFGTRMHHKFVVLDFNKPSARVYLGSYNFSPPADTKNGENLLLIRDRRVAVAYAVEALRMFDHYHFRVVQQSTEGAPTPLALKKPPRQPGEQAWWEEDYTEPRKIRERKLFA